MADLRKEELFPTDAFGLFYLHQPALRGLADHRPIGGAVLRQQISPDARIQSKDWYERLSLPDAAAAPRSV